MTTLLLRSLLLLAIGPSPADQLADRPHGAIMGDGLRLTSEPEPVGGGICADGETVFGIDVSYYQETIDWNAVAADGVEYAFVRVSHSTLFFDPEFETNLAGSRAAGIHTGVYQYFEPDEDPIAQADLLLESLGPLLPGDLPPVIDVESSGGLEPAAVASAVRQWVDHVEAQLGVTPIIYTGFYFWQDNVGSPDFGGYPLWIAWYGVDCPGSVPTGWSQWAFHQYSDSGIVDGVNGNTDVNRFNGSLADLEALGAMPEPCGQVGAEGGTLDNGDACYQLYGNAEFWREEPVGEGGSLVWTNAIEDDTPSNFVRWDLFFEEAGLYEVEVNIVQPFGETAQAAYLVQHAGGEDTVLVDQSANEGWVSLGEFTFGDDVGHSIRLGDNTGEPSDAEVSIVFDAIRLTRLDGDAATSGPGESTGDLGDESGDGTGGAGSRGGGESSAGNDEALPQGEAKTGSCACRSSADDAAAWFMFGMLGLLRRRRA